MGTNSYLAAGARLLARRKAVIAWLFAGHLVLGIISSLGVRLPIANILNRSLYSDRLANGFDVIALIDLVSRPDLSNTGAGVRTVAMMIVFGALLFAWTPGIMSEFLASDRLGTERFWQACGAFFWRFVRVVLLSWMILFPTLGVLAGIRSALVDQADKSWHVRLPFIVFVGASVAIQLVGLVLRAWFDTAEFSLLHANQSKARRAIGEARRMTRGYRARLLWIYLVPTVLMWVVTILIGFLWIRIPPTAIGVGFIFGQAIILVWVVCRLWQRATLATWFLEHVPAPMLIPIEPATTAPESISSNTPDGLPIPEVNLP